MFTPKSRVVQSAPSQHLPSKRFCLNLSHLNNTDFLSSPSAATLIKAHTNYREEKLLDVHIKYPGSNSSTSIARIPVIRPQAQASSFHMLLRYKPLLRRYHISPHDPLHRNIFIHLQPTSTGPPPPHATPKDRLTLPLPPTIFAPRIGPSLTMEDPDYPLRSRSRIQKSYDNTSKFTISDRRRKVITWTLARGFRYFSRHNGTRNDAGCSLNPARWKAESM